jgi:hypothetical protein
MVASGVLCTLEVVDSPARTHRAATGQWAPDPQGITVFSFLRAGTPVFALSAIATINWFGLLLIAASIVTIFIAGRWVLSDAGRTRRLASLIAAVRGTGKDGGSDR